MSLESAPPLVTRASFLFYTRFSWRFQPFFKEKKKDHKNFTATVITLHFLFCFGNAGIHQPNVTVSFRQ